MSDSFRNRCLTRDIQETHRKVNSMYARCSLSFVFSIIGAICTAISLCIYIYLVYCKWKKAKAKGRSLSGDVLVVEERS